MYTETLVHSAPLAIATTVVPGVPGVLRVVVVGDVDEVGVPALRRALAEAAARHPVHLEVDLGRVTFFSVAGLEELFTARQALGGAMTVVTAGPSPRRLLEVLQLQPLFGLPPSP